MINRMVSMDGAFLVALPMLYPDGARRRRRGPVGPRVKGERQVLTAA